MSTIREDLGERKEILEEILQEAVRFDKVFFSYNPDGENETVGADKYSPDRDFALRGVDLCVKKGEFVAVLGHNGSGKSTLARLVDGLLFPTSGKITVLGQEVKDGKNIFEIRKQVGIVFQNPDNQTVASIVEDDIAFGPENVGVPREEIGKRIDFALHAVGMSAFRHSTSTELSGGQKQRIAIAGVLAMKPQIMILDESTAMLDPKGRREVVDVVKRLNEEEGITVILITHFPEEAMLADRAVVMNRGEVVMQGAPKDILKKREELETFNLTIPRPLKICEKLRSGGMDVQDAFSAKELAEEIARFAKTAGAGTKVTGNLEEKNVRGAFLSESEKGRGRIDCEGLSYTYNESSPFSSPALLNVNLRVEAGEFFGIIGHTGSGKSTFVQHLNALIKLPSAMKKYKPKKKKGAPVEKMPRLTVAGFDLADKKTDFKALRSKVGMVFQYPEYQLFAETVKEDVAFGLKNFSDRELTEEEILAAVKEAIDTVGLDYEEIKNRSPFELSGGQKRRVAIAGVIVTKPEILVLDEPAAGLDPLGKEEIMALLHKIHKEWCKTVVIVSHDMDEIAENCTRAAVFSEGRILAEGTPREIFNAPEKLFASGLDVPFTAKVLEALKNRGIVLSSDHTTDGFTASVLSLLGDGEGRDA